MSAWASLIGLVLRLLAMLGLYAKGRGDEKAKARAQNDRENLEALKDMENAQDKIPTDPDSITDWLRKRGKL